MRLSTSVVCVVERRVTRAAVCFLNTFTSVLFRAENGGCGGLFGCVSLLCKIKFVMICAVYSVTFYDQFGGGVARLTGG